MPVAIIATLLDIAMFYHNVSTLTQEVKERGDQDVSAVTANINTSVGIHPTVQYERSTSSGANWQFHLIPFFYSTDDNGVTWSWSINFRSLDYNLLILLLLTLSPLSLSIACISGSFKAPDTIQDPTALTAREIWRYTGRKALQIFAAFVIFVAIIDTVAYLYVLLLWLIPSVIEMLPMEWAFKFMQVANAYLLVTLSLYSACLILENNSTIGIFRRSHRLVSSARLRFFGIYLLTGWIASVITAVLFGSALLVFSIFVPELAQARDALSPLKFLSLFTGGNIDIVLPHLPNIPTTVAIFIVKALIAIFLVPIWAILTTHLYLERTHAEITATEPSEKTEKN